MPKKILLIEDELQLIEIYETILKKTGFKVETLRYGFEAQQRLKEIIEGKREKPDLILLDLILPDMNGIEILKEAKNNEATKEIPFFILTNYSDSDLEEISKQLKAEKYIIKTEFTPSQLAKLIDQWFRAKNTKS